jgi:uncharacterized protein DUF4082
MKLLLRSLSMTLVLLTLGLGLGPRVAQGQNRDRWGINDDSGITTETTPMPGHWGPPEWGPGAYARAYEAGFGWSRYGFYWNNLNPSSGSYDFASSDFEVNAIVNNGLQVYAGIMWAPNWAVQGTPGYCTWYCGSTSFEPGGTTNNTCPASTLPGSNGCDQRMPDTAAFQTFVRQAVSRYGDRIRYWGFWNEPNYLVFWHSRYNPANLNDDTYFYENLQNLVDNILIPGYEAAKAVNPNVQIVGPEIDHPGGLEYILQQDALYYQRTQPHHHFFDVISFHRYPPTGVSGDATLPPAGSPPAPGSMWDLLDQYKSIVQAYRDGRPVWVTESNSNLATVDQLFKGFEQRDWIDKFFYYGYKSGYCKDPSEATICGWGWSMGTPGEYNLIDEADFPLDAFYKVQSVIAPRIFTTQTPATIGNASPGYEVATQFSAAVNGTVKSLRFYRAPGETGTTTVRLWTDSGTQLAAATWTSDGTSGWKAVPIGGGVALTAGTRYRVSFNTNTAQAKTNCGLGSGITNGPLTAWQGFWGQPMGSMPTNSSCSNFFADVVFEPGTEIFTSQAPATFGSASPGYEVATQFSSSVNGTIKGLRFFRAPGEIGDNILRLWTDSGTLLASGRFVDNGLGASGWQEVAIGAKPITAGTRYRVSVNTNTMQSKTNCGLGAGITNGPLTAWQGFWGQPVGAMPTNASCSNFFVDPLLSW